MGRLDAKVSLITGGGSGVGREASLLFAAEGARVVIADIAVEEGDETASDVRRAEGEAVFVYADVSEAGFVHIPMGRLARPRELAQATTPSRPAPSCHRPRSASMAWAATVASSSS